VEELWKKTHYWIKRSKTSKQHDSVSFLYFTVVAIFILDIWKIQYINNHVFNTRFTLLLHTQVRMCCRISNSFRNYDSDATPPPRTIITPQRMPRDFII
jgi:hypothetical protein